MNNKIHYKELVSFSQQLLKIAGLDKYSLDAVTKGLCETSLRGVDSQMICAKKRMKDGIPLDDSTLDALVEMSKKNNVILKLI